MGMINAVTAIRATTSTAALAAAVLVVGLAGCSPPSGPVESARPAADKGDGTRCGDSVVAGPVYIDIAYAADGTPIDPGNCVVASGTDVTWRGPSGEPVRFEIHFKATAPLDRGERGLLPSAETGGRYKVMRKVSGAKGRYDYGIRANGKELDPAIIIH